jgi:hypothetical protein
MIAVARESQCVHHTVLYQVSLLEVRPISTGNRYHYHNPERAEELNLTYTVPYFFPGSPYVSTCPRIGSRNPYCNLSAR